MAKNSVDEWSPGLVRQLEHFHRPYLAVDIALLTLLPDAAGTLVLHVLLVEVKVGRSTKLALPGVLVDETETLREAAQRAMADKAGVPGREPEQLRLVDDVLRDPRARVVTVAHADLVPSSQLGTRLTSTRLVPVWEATGLAYDHDDLVALALGWARDRYDGPDADPSRLLEHPFSATELRDVHAAVSGEDLHVTTILKRYGDQLERRGRRSSGRGRPYELFVVREE
jgi:8-oxo-dGTP diphosphatase